MQLMRFLTCVSLIHLINYGLCVRSPKREHRKSLYIPEDMERLFVVYDAPFLALVWPKIRNGVHVALERRCWADLSTLYEHYLDGRAWAYKSADATGRYAGAFFTGNKFWLGSKQQCALLTQAYESREEKETWGEFYSGDYLQTLLRREKRGDKQQQWQALVDRDAVVAGLARADAAPPFPLHYSALALQLNITHFALAKSYDVTLGVCLPKSCPSEDVASIVKFSIMLNDHLKSNNSLGRAVKITSVRRTVEYDIKEDVVAVLTILIALVLILLATVATLVDLECFGKHKSTLDINKLNFSDTERNRIDTKPVVVGSLMKNLNYTSTLKISDVKPPSITLGVVSLEGTGNCRRCGKYRKQCAVPRSLESFPPCPRAQYSAPEKNGLMKDLLLSFSIKRSWMKIFNKNIASKDLAVVHALKIVVTLWIIFIHVAVIVSYISDSGDINEHNSVYYILTSGSIAFDTLFFVRIFSSSVMYLCYLRADIFRNKPKKNDGVLSAHHFLYLSSQYSARELVACGGRLGRAALPLCFVINRAIRLLPPYMYTIFVSSVLSRARRGSALSAPRDALNCDRYWWRNLLYITNYYPASEQCMQISWYVSAEAQAHAAGAVLCALLVRGRRWPALAAVLLLLVPTGFDVFAAYNSYLYRFKDAFDAYAVIIEGQWSRVAAYTLGVLTAWLVHNMDGLLTVSKLSSAFLWIWSACAGATCVVVSTAGAHAGWLAGCAHLVWPTALMWPAVVFSTKFAYKSRELFNGSAWRGASRLCYSVLLVHAPLAQFALLAPERALHAHGFFLLCYYTGVVLCTWCCSLLLALLLEMPLCALLRRLADLVHR